MELILKEYKPQKHNLLKENGQLEKLKEQLAETMYENFLDMWDWMDKHRTAEQQYGTKDLTPQQLSSANLQNVWDAREMIQEDLKNLLLS